MPANERIAVRAGQNSTLYTPLGEFVEDSQFTNQACKADAVSARMASKEVKEKAQTASAFERMRAFLIVRIIV